LQTTNIKKKHLRENVQILNINSITTVNFMAKNDRNKISGAKRISLNDYSKVLKNITIIKTDNNC